MDRDILYASPAQQLTVGYREENLIIAKDPNKMPQMAKIARSVGWRWSTRTLTPPPC